MYMKEIITRINELAKKKRAYGLNNKEQEEQKKLYKEYLSLIRKQIKGQLERIEITASAPVKH